MSKSKVRLDFQAAADVLAFHSCSFKCNITHSPAGDQSLVNCNNSNTMYQCGTFYLERLRASNSN